MPSCSLHLGDCLSILPTLEADSVDAVVTDPPAGISFMGKAWDRAAVMADMLPVALRGSLRVTRPGGLLVCWALPRTSHWTGLAIESAGWEIQDVITHHFGTGFPKHKSKLKPATEFWWLARKPGPKWLGVDACRIGTTGGTARSHQAPYASSGWRTGHEIVELNSGRWPANLCLSHGPTCANGECGEGCPVRLMGEQSGESSSRASGYNFQPSNNGNPTHVISNIRSGVHFSDSGTAARFFPCFDHDPFIYAAKASRRDRNEGCEGMGSAEPHQRWVSESRKSHESGGIASPQQNHHPTVKSVHLMRWLCRLACPEGGTILDPFMGSGSTGKAATLEGFGFVGIERDPEYFAIAERRIEAARTKTPLFDRGTDAIPA